jgi:23S rRNA pseudouridine1911/1915/1917 synthase
MLNRNQPNYHDEYEEDGEQGWRIQEKHVGLRLDRFLTMIIPEMSRTTLQQLVANGAILVNNKLGKPGYALRLHDMVSVTQMDLSIQRRAVTPQALPLNIVYEDNDLLIINKAAGMVVHPAPGHYNDTVVNALVARHPQLQATDGDLRPGIVHRLDRDTSGLLIVAKQIRVQSALIEQMKRHEIEKRYLALVEGIVSLERGSIDAPIGRDPRHRQLMTITTIESREAVTHFRVLQRFAHHTLLLLQLETGRTHQIRVHLKAIGHPVLGDPVYGSGRIAETIALKRQFLHAYQLRFAHPSIGKILEIEAPLPADLQSVLDSPQHL